MSLGINGILFSATVINHVLFLCNRPIRLLSLSNLCNLCSHVPGVHIQAGASTQEKADVDCPCFAPGRELCNRGIFPSKHFNSFIKTAEKLVAESLPNAIGLHQNAFRGRAPPEPLL